MSGNWWDEKDRLKREKKRLERTSLIPYILAGVVFLYISALVAFTFIAKKQWDEGNKMAARQDAAKPQPSPAEREDTALVGNGGAGGMEPASMQPLESPDVVQAEAAASDEGSLAMAEDGGGRELGELAGNAGSAVGDADGHKRRGAAGTGSGGTVFLPYAEERTDAERLARVFLRNMSTEEKIAQLFFISPEALTGVEEVTRTGESTREAYRDYPVGGIVYARENLWNDTQTTEMLSEMQALATERSGFPIFLGVEEAGGSELSVASNSAFDQPPPPSMQTLSENGEAEAVRAAGAKVGAYLAKLGFNLDFAPNADVLTEPGNSIGDRSFGSDPERVSAYAWAFAEGLHESGVLACYKHFPGQGGTRADTHDGYAYTYKTATELAESELRPFEEGGKNGLEAVLVSHIAVPSILADDTPSSISSRMVAGLLRKELGFEGIIIADDLNDGAIRAHYEPGEAASLAFSAGCDMLLLSGGFHESYETLLAEARSGSIPEERLDASVYRILKTKLSLLVE